MSRDFRLFRPLRLGGYCRLVKTMILGFDFYHNPVCFMSARPIKYKGRRSERFAESADENYFIQEYSDKHYHGELSTFRWSRIRGGNAERYASFLICGLLKAIGLRDSGFW